MVPALHASNARDPSGLLSATNLCALYAHMALRHAREHPNPADWRLVNSRLSVTALSWKSRVPLDLDVDDDDVVKKAMVNARSSICIDLEAGADGGSDMISGGVAEADSNQLSQFSYPIYLDGLELTEFHNDLSRTIT